MNHWDEAHTPGTQRHSLPSGQGVCAGAGGPPTARSFRARAWTSLGYVRTLGGVSPSLVAVYRIRVGRKIGSAALVADGLHAHTDGMTSLAVVIGAIGVAAGFRRPTRSSGC